MPGDVLVDDEQAAAAAALAQVHDDPAAAEAAASALLDVATDPQAVQVAMWARGRARHELGRYDEALADLRRATDLASERGDLVAAARIGANRALTEYAAGDVAAARSSLDAAEAHLVGGEAGHLHLQRAIIHVHEGELHAGRASFDRALTLLEAADDRAAVLRCRTSRAVASTYLGDLDAAAADLTQAIDLAEALGQRLLAAGATHNLGYVRARAGDPREALEHFARAEALYTSVGSPERVLAALEQDRAEALLDAGLLPEAVAAARAAVARHRADGAETAAQDAELLLVDALLAAGEHDAARAAAVPLAEQLAAAGRGPLAARARAAAARAALAGDGRSRAAVDEALRAHRALVRTGWRTEADRLAVDLAARLAAGRPARRVADLLAPVAATRAAGTAPARLRAWHAEALLRLAEGDRRGALRAVRRGLHLADEHRRALAGDEVRAGAAHRSSALAELGLRLAVREGRAAAVLAWSEEARARSLLDVRLDRGGGRDDGDELQELLASLRQARAAFQEDETSVSARRRVTALERRIRDLDHRRGGGAAAALAPVGATALRRQLDGAVLVSYSELDGRLHGVAVDDRRARHLVTVPVAEVREVVDRLRLAMSRLVRSGTSPGRSAALAGFEHDRAVLARQLRTEALGDGPVVVVPSASLAGVPWAALPPLAGRPVTVTPSATHWCRPPDPPARGRPLFVAGPGLAHAEAEVTAIAGASTDVLVGPQATVAAVAAAFGARRLLHVAAHGEFRADAPLFGGVELADGRLTLLDLRGAPGHPEVVVLPACHLGAGRALPGGETLGAVAGLLGLGVRTVVAPHVAVADDVAAELMRSFHARLGALGPAAALGAATGEVVAAGGPAVATAATFTCAGRG